MKAESNVRPQNRFEIENIINGRCEIVFYDNIREVTEEVEGEEKIKYEYDVYRLPTNYRNGLELELNTDEDKFTLYKNKAVRIEFDEFAEAIRMKRNKLLEETDKDMCLDRVGFQIPGTISMTTIIQVIKNFFDTLKDITKGEMAKYRQDLRDITKQEGFPYNVTWPIKPEANSNESED